LIPPPQIPDSEWLDLVSPTVLREGKTLAEAATNLAWDAPILRGKISDAGNDFSVELDLRSRTIPRCSCACETGQARQICRHALAIYFAYFAPLLKAAEAARKAAAERENVSAKNKNSRPAQNFSEPKNSPEIVPANDDFPNSGRTEIDGGREWISIVLPPKESPCYEKLHALLKRANFVSDTNSQRWFLRGEQNFLDFFAEHRRFLERDCDAKFSHKFRNFVKRIESTKIHCETKELDDGSFDFEARIVAKGVPDSDLAAAIVRGAHFLRRKDGKIVLIEGKEIRALDSLRERLGREEFSGTVNVFFHRFSKEELPSASAILEAENLHFSPPENWQERAGALRNLSRLKKPPVPETLFSRLRAYQQIGVAWFWHLHKNGLCGLLADEMGLGKTVEAIAYLSAAFSEETQASNAPIFLLVVPAGLIENWRRELERFAPEIPVRVHHGQHRAEEAREPFAQGVVITSYSTLARDIVFFRSREWHTIIADEAQQIKNRRSNNARSLKEIFSKTRFVLTGTPIENSHEDLRSIFEFLMPNLLPSRASNASSFSRRNWNREMLKNFVAPYILRRTKSAVAPELPSKIEQTIWCKFSDEQARLYDEIKTRSREEIFKLEMSGASDAHLRVATFARLLRLRQICTEPRIVEPKLSENDSAKLRALRELIDEARASGHRMLVFSQFVSVLDFLADALEKDEIAFCRIDGSTRERAQECERFNNSPEIPVFLISLKAGGIGLNITGADMVVHYDPWWNPAAESQAEDRAHRIGQTRTVMVTKLVVADSIEERVLSLQKEKRFLLEELFEATAPENAKISISELKELLD